MTASAFLSPVLALIIWTLLIWVLMYARRIPAMQAAKIDPDTAKSPDDFLCAHVPHYPDGANVDANILCGMGLCRLACFSQLHSGEFRKSHDSVHNF